MAFFQRFNSFIEFINGFCFCNSPKVQQNSFFVWSDIIAGFGQPTIPSLFAMEVTQTNFAVWRQKKERNKLTLFPTVGGGGGRGEGGLLVASSTY